jgi:hypothetical protein
MLSSLLSLHIALCIPFSAPGKSWAGNNTKRRTRNSMSRTCESQELKTGRQNANTRIKILLSGKLWPHLKM